MQLGSVVYQSNNAAQLGGQAAVNGLSVNSLGKVVLGQDVGAAGNPAVLFSNREIPLGGFSISLKQATPASLVPQMFFINSAGGEQARLRVDDTGGIYFGVVSGVTATGNGNLGWGAGTFNAAGALPSNSIAFGALALFTATTGTKLCIVGIDTLNGATTGLGNNITMFGNNNFDLAGVQVGTGCIVVGGFNNNSGGNNAGTEVKIFGNTNQVSGALVNTTIIGSLFQTGVSNIVLLGNATQNIILGGALVGQTDNGNKLQVVGKLNTGGAAPLTLGASAMDFGKIVTAASVLNATKYWEITVDGVLVKVCIN